jgi:Fe-S oxidoreductase
MAKGFVDYYDGAAFVRDCTECGTCRPACPFLMKFGEPRDVILNHPEDAFLCTNCGACNGLCPSGLSPADALLGVKHRLLALGRVPRPIWSAVRSARRFVSLSHGVFFAHYAPSATVFWPGCGLGAMSPRLVNGTMKLLRDHVDPDMGMVLDCCGEPLYQLGDLDGVEKLLQKVGRALETSGVKRVITGCVNCRKLLSRYLKEIEVRHVLTVIPEISSMGLQSESVFVHHPCTAFLDPAITGAARSVLRGQGLTFDERARPMCCGQGGRAERHRPGAIP